MGDGTNAVKAGKGLTRRRAMGVFAMALGGAALEPPAMRAESEAEISHGAEAIHKEIAFNACTHTELIRLSYSDFERLVKPKVLKFAALQSGTAASGR